MAWNINRRQLALCYKFYSPCRWFRDNKPSTESLDSIACISLSVRLAREKILSKEVLVTAVLPSALGPFLTVTLWDVTHPHGTTVDIVSITVVSPWLSRYSAIPITVESFSIVPCLQYSLREMWCFCQFSRCSVFCHTHAPLWLLVNVGKCYCDAQTFKPERSVLTITLMINGSDKDEVFPNGVIRFLPETNCTVV